MAASKREGEDGMGGGEGFTMRGLLVLPLAILLASCTGTVTSATNKARPTPATIPTPNQPDPNVTAVPNAADWPQQDSPFAQASAQLQQAWAAYGVTIIPSRHVFDNVPAVPPVVNKTNGAVTQAQAQQMGLAYYRTDALWGWADAHDQMKLQLYLSNQGFLNTAAGQAEAQGEPVTDPPCDLFPTKMAVFSVNSDIRSFIQQKGYTVSSPTALLGDYATPCSQTTLTSTGPEMLFNRAFGLEVGVETGSVREDPVLGLVYVAEGARECPNSGYPTPLYGGTFPPGSVPTPGGAGGPEACYAFGN